MPPKADNNPAPGISDDQLSLLFKVCERAQSMLTSKDWKEISETEGGTAEATRQRFSYIVYKIKTMDDYANGRETEEYKMPKSKNRHAKKSLDALVEDDEEKIKKAAPKKAAPKKPAPRRILRHVPKEAKIGDEEDD